MIAQYTTEEGYTLTVFSDAFLDFGLRIEKNGCCYYHNPHCLSYDVYGVHWEDEEGNPYVEGVLWTEQEWKEMLENEAEELLEAFLDEDYDFLERGID